MLRRDDQRTGLTLVELVVVIAIIAMLAALTALYFPRFQEQELVARGADQIQAALLMAKQRAKRDGVPTGIRLVVVNQPNSNVNVHWTQLVYIQQPDDVAQGLYKGPLRNNQGVITDAYTADFENANFASLPQGYQPTTGDYLEVYGGGVARRIASRTNANQLKIDDKSSPQLIDVNAPPTINQTGNARTNYRIILGPREITGEQPINLPLVDQDPSNLQIIRGVIIDRTNSKGVPSNNGVSEILFSPSGAVVGQGTGNAQIILWVRDLRPDNKITAQQLICVHPRTGFIAAHPVDTTANGDPYSFTKDARSSGM